MSVGWKVPRQLRKGIVWEGDVCIGRLVIE